MKACVVLLFAILFVSCEFIGFEPPQSSSLIIANVYWRDQGVAERTIPSRGALYDRNVSLSPPEAVEALHSGKVAEAMILQEEHLPTDIMERHKGRPSS
jgi:hypothetical protein